MSKRFGYGFEKKDADRPSIQDARSHFLSLLPELRPHLIPSLLSTCYGPFSEFIVEQAVNGTKPNWRFLQQARGATHLRSALDNWADLDAVWFLDHAVAFLAEAYSEGIDTDAIKASWNHRHSACGPWYDAIVGEGIQALSTKQQSVKNEPSGGFPDFHFKRGNLEFRADPPLFQDFTVWQSEVERRFRGTFALGVPRGAMTAFKRKRAAYLEHIEEVFTKKGFELPPRHWAEDHFKWFIELNIPSEIGKKKTVAGLSREYRKDRATIREGARTVGKLLGIDCIATPIDRSQSGRRPGTRSSQPHHRVA